MSLFNLARMSVSSSGTGNVTLSAAVPGFLTFDLSGCSTAVTGQQITYAINDQTGGNSEIGWGTYFSSSLLMTRDRVLSSTNGNAAIAMSNASQVFITPAATDMIPVGTIHDFAGSTAPLGWQLCFGQGLVRTTYAALFAVIGTQYGSTSSTTFSLPDCRGRATYGQGNMGGVDAGRITVSGGNFDGTILGNSGGTQSINIAQNQLPNVTPALTGTPVTPTFTGTPVTPVFTGTPQTWPTNETNVDLGSGDASGPSGGRGVGTNNNTLHVAVTPAGTIAQITPAGSISQITPAGTVAINGGVTQNQTALINPAIIFTKIIYSGRP